MIEFIGLNDRNKLVNEQVIVDLCSFILDHLDHPNKSQYLLILTEVITECHDISSYTAKIESIYEEFDSDDENVTKLITLLFKFYSFCKNSKKKQVDEGNMRGALLERMTALLVKRRFFPTNDYCVSFPLGQNCKERAVHVSCNVKISEAGWETKNPIDIGAFDCSANWRGVCYECKVNLEHMEKSDEEILSELYQKGTQNLTLCGGELEVGVVSFLHSKSIKYIFKHIKSHAILALYGRDNMFDLAGDNLG